LGCGVGWLKSNFMLAIFLQFTIYSKFM
jgi:hypothetical protein